MLLNPPARELLGRLATQVRGLDVAAVEAEAAQTATRSRQTEISADDVTLAAILVTPGHLRPELRRAMREAGVDIERWAAYFTL